MRFFSLFLFVFVSLLSSLAAEPSEPKLIFKAMPAYPEAARQAGLEGRVHLGLLIDATGLVEEIDVMGEADPELAAAAKEAVIGWRFEPPMVAVRYEVTVNFKLDSTDKIPAADDPGITEPKRLDGEAPKYPEAARLDKIQGSVVLHTVIDADGTVRSIQVAKGLPGGLSEAAIRAVEDWRFEPARRDGLPIAVRYVLTVSFRLE